MSTTHAYRLKKQKEDPRDFKFKAVARSSTILPVAVDLRSKMPPVLDQGSLGSCASHAMANTLHYLLRKEGAAEFSPSRLFLYYNTRVKIESASPTEDTGVALRDMCKALSKWHACKEDFCPYVIEDFWKCPTKGAYADAKLHNTLSYYSVLQNLKAVKSALADGFPVVFGLQIYDSFESDAVASTGLVPMPDVQSEGLLGGHALTIVGYDDVHKTFIVMNSWAASWGDGGYCHVPYAYLMNPNLAWDFWVVKLFI